MECVITEHGIAQVPALGGIPDFNLEEELAGAGEFLLEPAAPHAKGERKAAAPRMVGREELSGMVSHAAVAGARSEEE